MGIAMSSGVIRDFAGPFYVSVRHLTVYISIQPRGLAVYCTVVKHNRHLRTQEKCRKHSPGAHVFYISRVFSNVARKTLKHAFSMFDSLLKHGFLTSQSTRKALSILEFLVNRASKIIHALVYIIININMLMVIAKNIQS